MLSDLPAETTENQANRLAKPDSINGRVYKPRIGMLTRVASAAGARRPAR
jgi:hypothetical protein